MPVHAAQVAAGGAGVAPHRASAMPASRTLSLMSSITLQARGEDDSRRSTVRQRADGHARCVTAVRRSAVGASAGPGGPDVPPLTAASSPTVPQSAAAAAPSADPAAGEAAGGRRRSERRLHNSASPCPRHYANTSMYPQPVRTAENPGMMERAHGAARLDPPAADLPRRGRPTRARATGSRQCRPVGPS